MLYNDVNLLVFRRPGGPVVFVRYVLSYNDCIQEHHYDS